MSRGAINGLVCEGGIKCTKMNRKMHYPTLETVIMVEDTLKRAGPISMSQLHRSTERQIMWGTLRVIISYLESRNMVATAKDGKIVWIFNPKLVEKYRKRKGLEWRK
jgi:hypothetical protein